VADGLRRLRRNAPRHENYIAIDKNLVDAWEFRRSDQLARYSENELNMQKDMVVTATENARGNGRTDIRQYREDNPPGLVIHETGTARRGATRKTRAQWPQQMWDGRIVFVTDGACMAATANQNPSITYHGIDGASG